MLPSPLGPKTRRYSTEQSRFAFPITVKISAWRHTISQAFFLKGTDRKDGWTSSDVLKLSNGRHAVSTRGWYSLFRYPEHTKSGLTRQGLSTRLFFPTTNLRKKELFG